MIQPKSNISRDSHDKLKCLVKPKYMSDKQLRIRFINQFIPYILSAQKENSPIKMFLSSTHDIYLA